MDYDIEDFEVGEEVKYVSECIDHDEAANLTDDNFMIGGYYKILCVTRSDNQVLLDIGSDYNDDPIEWWVNIRHLKPTKIVEPRSKYYKVIRKIQQMDRKRKEQGYVY